MIPNERPVIADCLWMATAHPQAPFPALNGPSRADVAVIGGGYTGLSAALHLAESGATVTLLETEQPGWGASGRNGGQINPGLKDGPEGILDKFGPTRGEAMIDLSGRAADLVFELIARHGIDCDAVRPGWIRAAHTPRALVDLQRLAAEWQARGAPVEALDKAQIAQLTGTESYLGGLIDRRGGNLHPLNYALGLARAAAGAGAAIHGGAQVTAIDRVAQGYRVATKAGAVTAGKVLVCTNAYAGPLHPRLAASVLPVRSVQVATAPLSDNLRASVLTRRHAVSDSRRLLLYFRTDAQGRLIMGGRGTYRDASTRRQIDHLRRVTGQLFPQLGDVAWEHAWGGMVAVTGDHYPHLHELAPGMMTALGYNGRGVAMATAMGRLLARWAGGQAADELGFPVTPVRPLAPAFARELLVEAEILRLKFLDRFGL
jgi:glycine/D-amino acid oxidase-like deaminating enzyme